LAQKNLPNEFYETEWDTERVFGGGAGEDGGGVLRRGDGEEQERIECDAHVFA